MRNEVSNQSASSGHGQMGSLSLKGSLRTICAHQGNRMPTHWRAVRQQRPAHLCAAPSLFVPAPNGLSVFCQRATAPRRSATRRRLVGSLSFGNLREPAIHGVAINHRQPAVAAFAATVRRSNSFVERSQASRPSPPKWSAIALGPSIIDAMPKMRVAKLVRGLSFGRPGSIGAQKMGAKCSK